MKSRERVLRAFSFKECDRAPVDFGATVVTCLEYYAYKGLKAFYGISLDDNVIIDHTMGTVEPCEKLKQMFGADFRRVSMNYKAPDIKNGHFTSGFGIVFKKADPHTYFDVVSSPLVDADVSAIENMQLPNPDDPALYVGIDDQAKDLYDNSPYAIVADFGVPGFYETSQKLRGYENLACDLLVDREFVTALYDRLLDLQKSYFKNYLEKVGKYANVICYADDLGMQDRPQISPLLYCEVIKPYHKAIFSYIHHLTDAKIMLHCCGSIAPLLGDLIDAGVDIINPVQVKASDMAPEDLKRDFGKDVIFWGGMDVQYVLPNGSPEEVMAEAEKLVSILGKDGGYVYAPAHNFQKDIPPENIKAMYRWVNN